MGEGVHSFWHEEPIGDDWTVSHRLVVEDGRTVIGETKISPSEGSRNTFGVGAATRVGTSRRFLRVALRQRFCVG